MGFLERIVQYPVTNAMRLHEYAIQEKVVNCRWCGESFSAGHAKARFCSDRCRQGWRRLKAQIINALKGDYPQIEGLLK